MSLVGDVSGTLRFAMGGGDVAANNRPNVDGLFGCNILNQVFVPMTHHCAGSNRRFMVTASAVWDEEDD